MNKELWDKIVKFDLDDPISEYGFSTRLANENITRNIKRTNNENSYNKLY